MTHNRHYNKPEFAQYVESALAGYALPKTVREVCMSEEILENTGEFVGKVVANKRIEPCFTKFKKIVEKKEIYPMETLLDLCADFVQSKVIRELK